MIVFRNTSIEAEHIRLVEAVNNAPTERLHDRFQDHLWGWREGVKACGYELDYCAPDMHYINQGNERPMCCGVWLDWTPAP